MFKATLFSVFIIPLLNFSSYACPSVTQTCPKYKLVDLGLQESDQSEGVAINDRGQVAGSYYMLEAKYYFIWNEQDGITLIDLPTTANIVVLNNAGQIAGNYKNEVGMDRGFIWDPNQGFSDIGTLGGKFTYVYDMNDLGQIVGESESAHVSLVDGRPRQDAFLWQLGVINNLDALGGDLGLPGDRSRATGINNHGQIIGISNYLVAHKAKLQRSNDRAVIWQKGVVEEVDPNFEGTSMGLSINDNDLIVYHKRDYRGYGDYLFNLKEKTSFKIKSSTDYFAKINNAGSLLYFPADVRDVLQNHNRQANELMMYGDNQYRSECLWSAFLKITQNDWKAEGFDGAYDFNNNNWIVCVARNIHGERHAVLLIPTEIDEHINSDSKQAKDGEKQEDRCNEIILSQEEIEVIIKETLHAAYDFYTADIEQKVRLLFLDSYSKNQANAKYVQDPYREILMLEALEKILKDIESLSETLKCERQMWFWETVQRVLNEKITINNVKQKLDAFIRIKRLIC